MDKAVQFFVFVILCFSVVATAVSNPETGQVVRSESITKLKGSHLKLDKTAQEERKSNETQSKTDEGRSARNALFGERQISKRGENEYSTAYENDRTGNDDFLVQYFPGEYPNEKYVYFESGGNYPGEVPDGRAPKSRQGPPPPRKPIEKSSCRQYLEFLKYAFEQIENSQSKYPSDQDYYYNYEDDYNRGESVATSGKAPTSEPSVAVADALKLRSLAFADNYETENSYSYVRKEFVNETEAEAEGAVSKQPESNRRMHQSTDSSELGSPSSRSLVMTMPSTEGETSTERKMIPPVTTAPTVLRGAAGQETSGTPTGLAAADAATTTTTTENINDSGSDVDNDDCQDKLFPCPDNMNVTYPVNGFCNRFVVCESGKPNSEFCQEGLHFNLVTKKCDLPHNSFCTYSCPKASGYFAVPGDCGGFFRCSEWYPEYRLCPPHMHWDSKAKICTFRELSSCPLKCDSSYEVKPYTGDCGSYIICTRGVPTYHTCPDGTVFDETTLKCKSENATQCQADPDYIRRNTGIDNGWKSLCATVELKGGKSKWCHDARKRRK